MMGFYAASVVSSLGAEFVLCPGKDFSFQSRVQILSRKNEKEVRLQSKKSKKSKKYHHFV